MVTPIDKWTFFIKNATNLHVIPRFADEDEGLKTAFIEADKYKWSKEDLIAYDNATIKAQDEKGEREKAIEDARMQSMRQVAKNLKTMGLSNTDIKTATVLSDEELGAI